MELTDLSINCKLYRKGIISKRLKECSENTVSYYISIIIAHGICEINIIRFLP